MWFLLYSVISIHVFRKLIFGTLGNIFFMHQNYYRCRFLLITGTYIRHPRRPRNHYRCRFMWRTSTYNTHRCQLSKWHQWWLESLTNSSRLPNWHMRVFKPTPITFSVVVVASKLATYDLTNYIYTM